MNKYGGTRKGTKCSGEMCKQSFSLEVNELNLSPGKQEEVDEKWREAGESHSAQIKLLSFLVARRVNGCVYTCSRCVRLK